MAPILHSYAAASHGLQLLTQMNGTQHNSSAPYAISGRGSAAAQHLPAPATANINRSNSKAMLQYLQ
jgi:hypothetical protein